MSYNLPGSPDPFAPPRAPIGTSVHGLGGDATEAEIIRRANISHEASVKSLGVLNYLGAFILIPVGCFVTYAGITGAAFGNMQQAGVEPGAAKLVVVGLGLFLLAVGVLTAAIGYGLRSLQPWARWTELGWTGLGLLINGYNALMAATINPAVGLISLLISCAIPGYIVYMMASSKSTTVFSRDYKAIIAPDATR